MKAAIAAAKGGDTSMMKFCLTLGMNRKDDAIKVDVPKLDSLAACRDAIGKVVQDALQGDLLPSEARAALELIERRRSSFAETESQREFEREYVRELVLCMMAKYHLGIGDAIDIRTIHRFAEDLPKLGLPQTIHDRVFRTFLDHALKEVQKDTSFGKDMTAEALMTEIIMYSLSMERSKARIKEIGLEAYNREVAELLKNYKLKAMK